MLTLLLGTHFFYPDRASLARNDFLTIMAVLIQAGMLAFRLESWEEAKVILAFHVTGTIMEQFKTQAGSWNYADGGYLHIGMVPLYSGFMYAAVGSYIARVWRIFASASTRIRRVGRRLRSRLRSTSTSLRTIGCPISGSGCLQLRCCCSGAPAFISRRSAPTLDAAVARLVPRGGLIWFAENIGTFAHAWSYPNQRHGWELVSPTNSARGTC